MMHSVLHITLYRKCGLSSIDRYYRKSYRSAVNKTYVKSYLSALYHSHKHSDLKIRGCYAVEFMCPLVVTQRLHRALPLVSCEIVVLKAADIFIMKHIIRINFLYNDSSLAVIRLSQFY